MYIHMSLDSLQSGLARRKWLQRRAEGQSQSPIVSPWGITVVTIVAIILLTTGTLLTYSYLRKMRLQHKVPKYLPGAFLKRKWMGWKPRGKYSTLDEQEEASTNQRASQVIQTTVGGVDRHTSVRSIISLPAYSRTPKETEEIIAREGERGGMDTVVEFPETVDEEEVRREEEMESLYQIRQTRRREIAEREERRRQRREAREAGDYTRLEELRRESRQRRAGSGSQSGTSVSMTAEMLIQEHNARGRDRRVSSVSYAAIGQVRHDGSRVRNASRESERGLLGQAAPMGDIPPVPHSRQGSEATFLSLNDNARNRSNSGAASISSVGSSFENVSSSEIRPITAGTVSSSHGAAHSISSNGSDEADIVDERVEPLPVAAGSTPLPPDYEALDWGDAPAYEERERQRLSRIYSIRSRNSQLVEGEDLQQAQSRPPRIPSLQLTPTIQIQTPTQPNSPAVMRGSGFSPVNREHPEIR